MVVANRVAWIRQSIVNGVHVRLHVGAAQDPDKCKVRATIDPHKGRLCITTRNMLLATLDSLALSSDQLTVMDRGHRHSTGISEVCFWSQLNNATHTGIGSRNDDDDDDADEDDSNDDHADKDAKRKFQSHDTDKGPWQDGNDPWCQPHSKPSPGSSRANAELSSKKPRKHDCSLKCDPMRLAPDDMLSDMFLHNKVSDLDRKIDLVLAGMSLAIGPGFASLLQENCPDPPSLHQPDAVASPLKATARCLVFDMFDSEEDDSSYSEAARLDLEGDFKFLPDVFGLQHLDINALKQVECDAQCLGSISDCDAKSAAPVSYDGSIADNAPAVVSGTDGCAVSESLNADIDPILVRLQNLMMETRIESAAAADSAVAMIQSCSNHLDEQSARVRETTHMNNTCFGAAHVRPSCTNGYGAPLPSQNKKKIMRIPSVRHM